jgi:hypothetical protein
MLNNCLEMSLLSKQNLAFLAIEIEVLKSDLICGMGILPVQVICGDLARAG